MMRELPSPARLRALFDYDAEQGWLIWRERPECSAWRNSRWAGKRAGSLIPTHELAGIQE
jgi:hypothetical protein